MASFVARGLSSGTGDGSKQVTSPGYRSVLTPEKGPFSQDARQHIGSSVRTADPLSSDTPFSSRRESFVVPELTRDAIETPADVGKADEAKEEGNVSLPGTVDYRTGDRSDDRAGRHTPPADSLLPCVSFQSSPQRSGPTAKALGLVLSPRRLFTLPASSPLYRGSPGREGASSEVLPTSVASTDILTPYPKKVEGDPMLSSLPLLSGCRTDPENDDDSDEGASKQASQVTAAPSPRRYLLEQPTSRSTSVMVPTTATKESDREVVPTLFPTRPRHPSSRILSLRLNRGENIPLQHTAFLFSRATPRRGAGSSRDNSDLGEGEEQVQLSMATSPSADQAALPVDRIGARDATPREWDTTAAATTFEGLSLSPSEIQYGGSGGGSGMHPFLTVSLASPLPLPPSPPDRASTSDPSDVDHLVFSPILQKHASTSDGHELQTLSLMRVSLRPQQPATPPGFRPFPNGWSTPTTLGSAQASLQQRDAGAATRLVYVDQSILRTATSPAAANSSPDSRSGIAAVRHSPGERSDGARFRTSSTGLAALEVNLSALFGGSVYTDAGTPSNLNVLRALPISRSTGMVGSTDMGFAGTRLLFSRRASSTWNGMSCTVTGVTAGASPSPSSEAASPIQRRLPLPLPFPPLQSGLIMKCKSRASVESSTPLPHTPVPQPTPFSGSSSNPVTSASPVAQELPKALFGGCRNQDSEDITACISRGRMGALKEGKRNSVSDAVMPRPEKPFYTIAQDVSSCSGTAASSSSRSTPSIHAGKWRRNPQLAERRDGDTSKLSSLDAGTDTASLSTQQRLRVRATARQFHSVLTAGERCNPRSCVPQTTSTTVSSTGSGDRRSSGQRNSLSERDRARGAGGTAEHRPVHLARPRLSSCTTLHDSDEASSVATNHQSRSPRLQRPMGPRGQRRCLENNVYAPASRNSRPELWTGLHFPHTTGMSRRRSSPHQGSGEARRRVNSDVCFGTFVSSFYSFRSSIENCLSSLGPGSPTVIAPTEVSTSSGTHATLVEATSLSSGGGGGDGGSVMQHTLTTFTRMVHIAAATAGSPHHFSPRTPRERKTGDKGTEGECNHPAWALQEEKNCPSTTEASDRSARVSHADAALASSPSDSLYCVHSSRASFVSSIMDSVGHGALTTTIPTGIRVEGRTQRRTAVRESSPRRGWSCNSTQTSSTNAGTSHISSVEAGSDDSAAQQKPQPQRLPRQRFSSRVTLLSVVSSPSEKTDPGQSSRLHPSEVPPQSGVSRPDSNAKLRAVVLLSTTDSPLLDEAEVPAPLAQQQWLPAAQSSFHHLSSSASSSSQGPPPRSPSR